MDNSALGEQIKRFRASKKMTMAVMAERLGVTTSAIAAYENGSRNPSFDVLIKIARLFNVTIDNLLGYSNKDLIDVSELSLTQRDNVLSLISTYKKFNRLVMSTFNLSGDVEEADIDYYFTNDFERFNKLLEKQLNL